MTSTTFTLGNALAPNYAKVTVTEVDFNLDGKMDIKFDIAIDTTSPSPIYAGDILGVFFDLPSSLTGVSVYDSSGNLVQANPPDGTLPWLLPIGGSTDINMNGSNAGLFDDPTDLAVQVGTGNSGGWLYNHGYPLSEPRFDGQSHPCRLCRRHVPWAARAEQFR